jgi:ketosteroid isomerase-like protein
MNTAVATINEFYHAIIRKEVATICSNYAPSEQTYVFVEGPRYSTLGRANIDKGWHDFCDSALTLESVKWTEGPFVEETPAMAWVGGLIVLKVRLNDTTFERKFRATFVLKLASDGRWQIIHEHVSAPMEDPYGIGDWLKKE